MLLRWFFSHFNSLISYSYSINCLSLYAEGLSSSFLLNIWRLILVKFDCSLAHLLLYFKNPLIFVLTYFDSKTPCLLFLAFGKVVWFYSVHQSSVILEDNIGKFTKEYLSCSEINNNGEMTVESRNIYWQKEVQISKVR